MPVNDYDTCETLTLQYANTIAPPGTIVMTPSSSFIILEPWRAITRSQGPYVAASVWLLNRNKKQLWHESSNLESFCRAAQHWDIQRL